MEQTAINEIAEQDRTSADSIPIGTLQGKMEIDEPGNHRLRTELGQHAGQCLAHGLAAFQPGVSNRLQFADEARTRLSLTADF